VHERSLTLFASLESVRCQSIQNIEVIVAGDGATTDVRETIEAFAHRDLRFRVLYFDKEAGRGERNRDRAVRSASSERIFYIDDDDLWLPNHIEVLGPWLDTTDIVNTPIWAVLGSGKLGVLPGNYGSKLLRELLAQRTLKLIHDTHLAHRKDAYMRLPGGGWETDAEGRPVLNLLSQFAADQSLTWTSIPDMTALSFSSPPRWHYTETQRLVELLEWLPNTQSPTAQASFPPKATLVPFLFELASRIPPSGQKGLIKYFDQFCIQIVAGDLRGTTSVLADDNTMVFELTSEQLRDADTAFELIQGIAKDKKAVRKVLLDFAEVPHGKESRAWEVCTLLLQNFRVEESIRITKQIEAHIPRRNALRHLLLAYLYFKKGETDSTQNHLDNARVYCEDFSLEYKSLQSHISAAHPMRGMLRRLFR